MSHPAPTLRPREHGAYAMLAFPLASGLLIGGVSVAGVAFALLAVSGFLAHESALVVLGRRGERVRAASAAAARTRLAALGGVAAASALLYLATAPEGALAWAAPPALLGATVLVLVLVGGTKSLAGELLVAAAFASVHGAVARAGLATLHPVALPILVWTASFGLATLSVHALKARFRARRGGARGAEGEGPRTAVIAAAPVLAVASLALAGVALRVGHPLAYVACALIPKALLVLIVAGVDVHPRHLKRVGWGLVAADVMTLGVLALAG